MHNMRTRNSDQASEKVKDVQPSKNPNAIIPYIFSWIDKAICSTKIIANTSFTLDTCQKS